MEHGPFEDVFPIKNGDIPASYVSLPEGIICWGVPPPSNSHHQDDITFLVGDPYKPSFATVTGTNNPAHTWTHGKMDDLWE